MSATMPEVHQHPDGLVYVRTESGTYCDTVENLQVDGGIELPPLPAGADDRIYVPGKRHAIMGDGNIIEGGPMPWPLGDALIAGVASLLEAQNLRAPPSPSPLQPSRRLVLKSVIVERLQAVGKLAAAKAALDADLYARERWYAPDKPGIYADDPEAIALLAAIGADPEIILAPE